MRDLFAWSKRLGHVIGADRNFQVGPEPGCRRGRGRHRRRGDAPGGATATTRAAAGRRLGARLACRAHGAGPAVAVIAAAFLALHLHDIGADLCDDHGPDVAALAAQRLDVGTDGCAHEERVCHSRLRIRRCQSEAWRLLALAMTFSITPSTPSRPASWPER